MAADHERSLVAWANTFVASSPTGAVPAGSLADFASGEALIPIARTILASDDDTDDDAARENDAPIAGGWACVFSLLEPAGLVEEDAPLPREDDLEEKTETAVTCLEELLRHTVGEHCVGRETFIRQIMSLSPDVQTNLRRIIVGEQPHGEATGSEISSPSRDDRASSFAGSPAPSASAGFSSPSAAFSSGSSCAVESPGGDDSSANSCDDSLGVKSWYSPHPQGSARRRSSIMAAGRSGERAAPVGPKPRQGRTLDMEEAEQDLVGATAASAASFSPEAAREDGAAGWTATAVEVVDLKAEVSRLKGLLEDTENTCAEAVSVAEAQRNAAVDRQEELSEDLRRARQAAERLTVSEEDAVIAAERDMRAKHEKEVEALQERASKAEERVFVLAPFEDEILRLRDEVDILRPAEAKLSKVEDNLSRCRAKIEELSGLPAQLKKEEDAHAKVLDRCLELEAEVAQIPQLKRSVDRYRRSHTDMEVAAREQSRELEAAQDEVSRLSQEVQTLTNGSGAVRDEQQRLHEELKSRALEDADAQGNGSGIGEGVSELNPALTEELARLRRANEQLTAKVDYNTEETIRELEQKADDASRLADSFHQNLASEREFRAAAEASLASALARIAELEAELEALRQEHERTVARMEGEAAAAEEARAKEREEMEGVLDGEREEGARKEAEAARALADAKREFDGEVAEVRRELEERLEAERRSAGEEIAAATERTAKEKEGRLEESRQKEAVKQEVRKLEGDLESGKQAALAAINRLKKNASELREESASMRHAQLSAHEAEMKALHIEFEKYRETHTVDDVTYHHDMDQWEMGIATKNKIAVDLKGQLEVLEKDKRRLEREKTYYWGQAEELRMSAAAGGRADPARDADHLQLVEQARELIDENRELRQRVQESGGGGGMSTRSGGRWGNSGVAAMRAEHEAEMTALKEEKQDMLLKYHDTSSKLNELERQCNELNAEVEDARAQVVTLQLVNKRQEKKLRDLAAVAPSSGFVPPSTQKENQNSSFCSPRKEQRQPRSTRSRSKSKGGVSQRGSISVDNEKHSGRGPLRGLGNSRQQPEEGRSPMALGKKRTVPLQDEVTGAVVAAAGERVDDETPPECAQS
ncbi:unnamed protein product [Scytosiphon promiscuus]